MDRHLLGKGTLFPSELASWNHRQLCPSPQEVPSARGKNAAEAMQVETRRDGDHRQVSWGEESPAPVSGAPAPSACPVSCERVPGPPPVTRASSLLLPFIRGKSWSLETKTTLMHTPALWPLLPPTDLSAPEYICPQLSQAFTQEVSSTHSPLSNSNFKTQSTYFLLGAACPDPPPNPLGKMGWFPSTHRHRPCNTSEFYHFAHTSLPSGPWAFLR